MIASLSRGSLLDEVLHGGFNEQQLAAYISWVNSQLKRKAGLKPITDLRRDLQDGVVLTQLIEIVAGEVLEGVYVTPQNKEESRKNVEEVLRFISSRHIRMPHISARDIVDGNLKSVMRIILALAAHFKPSANHRAASGSRRGFTGGAASHNPLSTVALAQGAAAALASARLDASLPARSTRIHRYALCLADESCHIVVETSWEDPLSESLEKEVQEARKMVSALQVQTCSFYSADVYHVLNAVQSSDELEVLRCKQDMRNLQGVKEAQQQRLCTQEASILQMKQELLRASMTKDELTNQNAELQWKLEECTRLWGDCKKELGQKDRLLQQFKHKLEESQKMQVSAELQTELEHKNNMLQQLMCRDLEQNRHSIHISMRSNKHLVVPGKNRFLFVRQQQADEVQLLRDALRSLRNNFRDHDPQHHTLDTLEQGIVSLIDRLHVLHKHKGVGKSPRPKGQHTDADSWPSSSKKMCQSHNGSSSSTKILYFTGKSPTPSMINIPKRLGEVTLKDVKAAVDREGNYRYHFKALDPEFGTVKEEVFLDGAVVPGWEGKIVAWVEEDRGEER
uniref:Dixin n=1 Tax=Salarias fasciatus TaxID=181472 RepID=A0A672GY09_SALFA